MDARPPRAMEPFVAAAALGLIGATADAGLFYLAVEMSGGHEAALGMTMFFMAALGAVVTVLSAGACFIAGVLELAGREAPFTHPTPHP